MINISAYPVINSRGGYLIFAYPNKQTWCISNLVMFYLSAFTVVHSKGDHLIFPYPNDSLRT